MVTTYNAMTTLQIGRIETIHMELNNSSIICLQGTRENDEEQGGDAYTMSTIKGPRGGRDYTRVKAGYKKGKGNNATGVSVSIREDLCEREESR